MNLVLYYADQSFVEQSYEGDSISVKSRFMTRQIDSTSPSSIIGELLLHELEDEVSFVQYGQQDLYSFYTLSLSQSLPSSWVNYPTRYKFMSFELHFSQDRVRVSRTTYGLLDFLGDLGGLYGILVSIGGMLAKPMSRYALQSALLLSAFILKKKAPGTFKIDKVFHRGLTL